MLFLLNHLHIIPKPSCLSVLGSHSGIYFVHIGLNWLSWKNSRVRMCAWSISGCAIDLFKNLWYCVPFPGHCHWQLVAKSSKMFNKPHVLSFLALPLYPCGCEPETDPRPPPKVRCNFACVLCVHMCSQFHIFLSCSRVSWRNMCWAEESN